jgi:hypothetical protein
MRRKGSLKRIGRHTRGRNGPCYERQVVRHARNRLGERYGLAISSAEYWAPVAVIKAALAGRGGSPLGGRRIYRGSARDTWHLLRIEGRPVIAVYDADREHIRTFLELGQLASIGLRLEDVA